MPLLTIRRRSDQPNHAGARLSGFNTFENPLGGDEMGGYGVLSMAERAELVGGRLNILSPAQCRDSGGGDDSAVCRNVSSTIPMPAIHPRTSRHRSLRPCGRPNGLLIIGVAPVLNRRRR